MSKARTAAVTGGSGGIGLECAKLLLERGYRVYCISRHAPTEPGLIHLAADVSDPAAMAAAFARIKDECGALDTLISNAGMGISGPVETTSPQDARRQFEVNFFGFHNAVRCAVPLMREKGGSIVVTSSVAAVFSIPFQAFYSASKAAVNSLALALANELAPFNIRVAALMPGDVKTGFTAARRKNDDPEGLYGGSVTRSVAVMEKDEQNGMAPALIARRIVALSESKNPKPLSTLGLQYKLFCFLGKVLPVRVQNFIVGKMYIK